MISIPASVLCADSNSLNPVVMMSQIIQKVKVLSKSERIIRLIQIAAKGDSAMPHELIELELIQGIRQANGEIDKIKKSRGLT